MVPHIEDLAAEPESEEFRGEFWVVFICSLSAPKQVHYYMREESTELVSLSYLLFSILPYLLLQIPGLVHEAWVVVTNNNNNVH